MLDMLWLLNNICEYDVVKGREKKNMFHRMKNLLILREPIDTAASNTKYKCLTNCVLYRIKK